MYASYTTQRPFLWLMCSLNAFHTPTVAVMWASQVLALHSVAVDVNDANDDRLSDPVLYRNLVDPDQNCHCLSLVWLHNIDYQTLHYPTAAILLDHSVLSLALGKVHAAADSLHDRFREMICKVEIFG